MIRLRHKLVLHAFRIFDQLVLVGTFLLLVAVIEEHGEFVFILEMLDKSYQAKEGFAIVVTLVAWLFVFTQFVRYSANRFTTIQSQAFDVLKATTFTSLVLMVGGAVFDVSVVTPPVLAAFWVVSSILLIASRVLVRMLLTAVRRAGGNSRHLVFVGAGAKALEIAARVEKRPELGYQIEGFFPTSEEEGAALEEEVGKRWSVLGSLEELRPHLEKQVVDEVMVCLPLEEQFGEIYKTVQMCRELGVVVRLVPDLPDVKSLTRSQLELFEGDYVVTFFRENLLAQLLLKRMMDVGISAIALLLTSPIFVVVALAIKFTSPGPVFFAQERVGMNKRRFKMLKFRSMVVDAEERKGELAELNEMDGPVFKIKKDPRVTRIGAFIRKVSIDELPQLINVLRGQMSLVGPRPPLWSEVDLYDWTDRRRLSIKPGITCLWQVSGRNELTFEEWMELDRQYIDNWSVWLDVKILLRTIPVVLFGYGAS